MEELIPCPFCGSKFEIKTPRFSNVKVYYLKCSECGCLLYGKDADGLNKPFRTINDAVIACNTRFMPIKNLTEAKENN